MSDGEYDEMDAEIEAAFHEKQAALDHVRNPDIGIKVNEPSLPEFPTEESYQSDPEASHKAEYDALWGFVAFVFGFSSGEDRKLQYLRAYALKHMDWDMEHHDRRDRKRVE